MYCFPLKVVTVNRRLLPSSQPLVPSLSRNANPGAVPGASEISDKIVAYVQQPLFPRPQPHRRPLNNHRSRVSTRKYQYGFPCA